MGEVTDGQIYAVLALSIPSFILFNFIFTSLGYALIFKKCGVKKRWAIIPVAKEYHMSLCADREKEGRIYAMVAGFYYLSQILLLFIDSNSKFYSFMNIPIAGLQVTMVIYMVKIYQGLVKMFNRHKIWVLFFVILEGPTLLMWGLSKRFVPEKQVEDYSGKVAAKTLGQDLAPVSNGLTVNIQDRTVIDFFRRKTLIKDIHMIIPKGHMVLLLGGSGAGKTTFLNAVTGYEKANAEIRLDNQDVYTDYKKMKYDIGFVPQQDLVRGADTVAMTVTDAASMRLSRDASSMEKENRIARMLDQFGLMSVKNNLIDKLSGGQRKRLSIALEFINDPTLFILDEPDSGLDGVVARNLFKSLRDIADGKKIVLVITHTPDRVIDLFDDVIVLAKDAKRVGRLAFYGPVQEAYEFFGKNSMEEILLSVNQKDEGGEGRADEFISKFADRMKRRVG